jgi:hypothetical protein
MKILDQDIDRHAWTTLGRQRFRDEYLLPLRPVVLTGGLTHWRASGTWTPDFFRQHHGGRDVTVDGRSWKLADLLDRIEASSADSPAPYLRNEWLAEWPKQVLEDITPMPECTLPNWLDSWAFPSRTHPTFVELYIGGAGAQFPLLHFDNWHTHAFLMQLYGQKEYLAFAPDQAKFLYPHGEPESNKSQINSVLHPDLERFPLFAQAQGIRFTLSPGETLFMPAGWWHTANIVTTSITVSINGANAANWKSFTRDYCRSIGRHSRLKAACLGLYMDVLGELLEMGSRFLL